MNHHSVSRRTFLKSATVAAAAAGTITTSDSARAESVESSNVFQVNWNNQPNRYFTGPQTWANPWEDWQVRDGRLICTRGAGAKARDIQLLTAQLNDKMLPAEMSVNTTLLNTSAKANANSGTYGFLVGIKVNDPIDDYRSRLLFGRGMFVGLNVDGSMIIGRFVKQESPELAEALKAGKSVELTCTILPTTNGDSYEVSLIARIENGEPIKATTDQVPADYVIGNVALTSTVPGSNDDGLVAFSDWQCGGEKFTATPDHALGPILWTMYTLSNRTMKLAAQMAILGEDDSRECELQVRNHGDWKTIATAPIDRLSRTATFKVTDWDDTRDIACRVKFVQKYTDGTSEDCYYDCLVRKDPKDKPEITVAGYCCFTDFLFPNKNIADQTARQDPDIMFFVGDQIYEGVGGWGIIRDGDLDRMFTNYLRKVALLGWSFRDVMRDRPTIWMPDDHDVYHGNVWGASGRKITLEEWSSKSGYGNSQTVGNKGGYVQPAEWIKAMERTQTSHLPDAFDPTPIQQGLGVYYTSIDYGRIGFAVLEDRKFKSGPMEFVKHNGHRPDWIVERQAALDADVPGAKLLGERQLHFLEQWCKDWKGEDMKMVVSQTVFANGATHHGGPDAFLVADMDSNGWPQTGRDKALDVIRRGHAFMLGGDQHLPTVIQHGIEKQHDAGFSFVVPAGATGYQRWWRPEEIDEMVCMSERHNDLPNTGQYRDGFGNLIDMWAVANPPSERTSYQSKIDMGHKKVSGWGIVRMNKEQGTATMEAWYSDADVTAANAEEGLMPNWPMTIDVAQMGGTSNPTLPPVQINGYLDDRAPLPVVQVTDTDGKVVSTVRMPSSQWAPIVYDADGVYTVTVLMPEENDRVLAKFDGVRVGDAGTLSVTMHIETE